jgi:transcriptional regulator GlxA family with amidase domain
LSKPPINNQTQQLTILVLPESSMMTLASVLDPLRAANRLSRLPLFSWQLVSLDGKPINLSCGVEIKVDSPLQSNGSGDLLIVVAGFNHQDHAPSRALVNLRKTASSFSTICGIEAGTWILARAGIINHHQVTTHWEDTENLADSYPSLDVRDERFVIDHRIWTSGGASPTFDMMLHYLRSTQNKSLALDVAGVFIYKESSAPTDAQTLASIGRIEELEPRLAKAIRIMEANLEDPIAISKIAQSINLSVRSLEQLSTKYLSVTPGAYYLRLRLQTARRLVLETRLSLLEISVRAGFNSQSAFSRAYNSRFGQSPLAMRNNSI